MQRLHILCNGGNDLHAGCASSNNGNSQFRHINWLFRPVIGVKRLSGEVLLTLVSRKRRRGEKTNRWQQEIAGHDLATTKMQSPAVGLVIPYGFFQRRVEAHAIAKRELLDDVLEILQVFRLGRKPLFPVPLIKQFF